MLEPKRKERGSQFFETYRACVALYAADSRKRTGVAAHPEG